MAFLNFRLGALGVVTPFSPERARYLALNHHQGNHDYSKAVVQTALLEQWRAKKIVTPGYEHVEKPPPLTPAELASIPGAEAAMGDIRSVKFETLSVVGDHVEIAPDLVREWSLLRPPPPHPLSARL
jgi:hypothetical protein